MVRKKSPKKILLIANIAAIIGLAGLSFYLFTENRDLTNVLGQSTEQKNAALIQEINEVYDLPDEAPIVAVVTDPEEFKAEYPTFDNADNGDYLLFFRKARLNVLYRQSDKKVLQTANVVVPIAIELLGSQEAVDAATQSLSEFGNQISITPKVTPGITQSFVFDVDGDQGQEAQSVATLLAMDLGSTLPSTITPSPQTEIIIAVSGGDSQPTEQEVSPQDPTVENDAAQTLP